MSSKRPWANAAGKAGPTWRSLPLPAQLYVTAVIFIGGAGIGITFPRTFPQAVLFGVLLVTACLTSTWKVNLPISVVNGSTLSVSYAANLMSLLLLGPQHAVVIAVAGVLTQCTYKAKQPYPVYRTAFSMAAAVITMAATGTVYQSLGGPTGPIDAFSFARPLVGAIATYFLVNTSLVAGAIALSTGRSFIGTWRTDFLWSGASFMVAGTAGALAAVVVARGDHWKAALLVAPVYLTYRTYELFVGRLEDQRRHTEEMRRLHQDTVGALAQAREAERALAAEKERLGVMLAEMTRLEDLRNQLLEREQVARESAESANRLKDQFLAVVSHELRTPLNAILGWAHMLRRGTLDHATRDRAFGTIYESAKRQAQLIDDLLDVSRITSGKLRLDRTVVDLADVIRDALQVVLPAAEAKGVRVTADAAPSLSIVYGDAARLQQVAWNLLSNAVKFTPEGGAVRVKLQRVSNVVELVVSDTGQGITPEFLSSVFEPFRQADGSTTRVHPGLGLGLSIVKSLVEAHNGNVTAQSAGEGLGATFTVRLPIAVFADSRDMITADRTAGHGKDIVVAPASLEGVSVLVVDDDVESRQVVAAHLQACQADVTTAASAAEAFSVLARNHVDVLLADIGMPDEDGYSLIRRIRASSAEAASVPAAALTAFARDEDRRKALAAGFQMHLAKPIDPQALVAAVGTLGQRSVNHVTAGRRGH